MALDPCGKRFGLKHGVISWCQVPTLVREIGKKWNRGNRGRGVGALGCWSWGNLNLLPAILLSPVSPSSNNPVRSPVCFRCAELS